MNHQAYTVGWICAVTTEYVAACELLDEEFPPLASVSPHDSNNYTLGRIGDHYIVVACLPKGRYGIASAASVAEDMLRSFESIRIGLMVGIAGGAPSPKHDIRLGDVVVGCPTGRTGGVLPFRYGKKMQGQEFEITGSLSSPPNLLLRALNRLNAIHERKGHQISATVRMMVSKNARLREKYQYPGAEKDRWYESTYIHLDATARCDTGCDCTVPPVIQRPPRSPDPDDPVVHYGIIASADRLMKDALTRDRISQRHGVMCFEMEAAGLSNGFPCVVIRGICDYSDSHKNYEWQGYAAATAAAYAKELLQIIPSSQVAESQRATEIVSGTDYGIKELYNGGANASIDIVFVHDINGNTDTTWFHKDSRVYWPRDLLSLDIPDARILSFGYDADVVKLRNASDGFFSNHAKNLVGALVSKRERTDTERRRILFVAHSIGGIVVKQTLINSRGSVDKAFRQVEQYTAGVVFLGDPLRGAGPAAEASMGTRMVNLPDMTKFPGREDPDYRTILSELQRWKNSIDHRASSVSTMSDVDVNRYQHRFGNTHASIDERKPLIETEAGENIKAQGDGYHALPERRIKQVDQDFREPYRKLTEEKAQELNEDERYMTEGQHTVDPASLEAFEHPDSAYGTASHGRDNGRFAMHSELMKRNYSTEEDNAEARSVYSTLSTTSSVMQTYLQDLADNLFSAIDTTQTNPKRLQRLCETLEQLLQQFAFRIGVEVSSGEGQEILYYVHRNRREIVNLFEQHLPDTHDDHDPPRIDLSDQIPAQEKVLDWVYEEGPNDDILGPTNEIPDTVELADDSVGTQTHIYSELILRTSAYQWLLDAMRQELTLTTHEEHLRDAIRKEITRTLPPIPKLSTKKQIRGVKLLYIVRWDPTTFISEQRYREDPHVSLERAITLTGTLTNAQALPCVQYMHQTWPKTGERTLRLIQRLLDSRQGVRTQGLLLSLQTATVIDNEIVDSGSDCTELVAWKTSQAVYVEVVGSRSSVVEIGEQLVWLSSALRSSPFAGIALCSPYIKSGDWDSGDMEGLRYRADGDSSPVVKIDFALEEGNAKPDSEGQCWHSLFRNPVIVRGFPIKERDPPLPGLEISLHIMAGLVQATRAYAFDETIILKGFSSMLVPTEQSNDMTLWHHYFHLDRSRITYLEKGLSTLRVSNFSKLQASRHIVGWCTRAENCAGKAGAKYDVARSRLPRVGSDCLLEKVSLTAGKYLTPGVTFAVGVRDIPVHLNSQPYVTKLNELRHKLLVFWDIEAKRGWLVNGLDGLLHLLRATLKHYETDELMKLVLESKSENIEEPKNEDPSKPSTESGTYAFNVLLNEKNMKLAIYRDKDNVEVESEDPGVLTRKKKFVRLEDRVEHLYSILEILLDHQLEKAGQSGVRVKAHVRRRLEGWDFKDLVSDNPTIFPLVETIETVGKGWVDFIRSIQAVTLFGKGFGDIMQPSDEICPHWRQLPEGKSYLAARVSDLEMIMETKNGDDMAVPRRICDGISWFSPTPPYELFPCSNPCIQRHPNPVQVLWPTSLTNRLSLKRRVPLPPEGAVIFGHNASFKWRWGDHGDPVKGDPTVEPLEHGSDQTTVTSSPEGSKSSENQSTVDTSLQSQVTEHDSEEIIPDPDRPASHGDKECKGGSSAAFAKTESRRPALLRRMWDKLNK